MWRAHEETPGRAGLRRRAQARARIACRWWVGAGARGSVGQVWLPHLEGRVDCVADRAVREGLAEAQAQRAKEDAEPNADEAHPSVELSRVEMSKSKCKQASK